MGINSKLENSKLEKAKPESVKLVQNGNTDKDHVVYVGIDGEFARFALCS